MYVFPTTSKKCPNSCKDSVLKHEEVDVPDFELCLDTQQIRIQEHRKITYIAKIMSVSLEKELVECFQPGERIIVW